MNAAVRKLLSLGIKARTLWLVALLFTTIGFYLGLAWAATVLKAPHVAVDLIEWVR